ncbi:MAG: hypothetical protein KKC79_14955 [Gammaproteobacteria bacterium]|nr:hypothetical protein [Gammaproteobacteria bacterium]MBU1443529.1 hypothetical protein [Gammaproteobacteria bacterium]MBU2286905.1 hypothetical protein [Gammaproteobacteria bacterium]MBU2409935.1 hypothetical protein [Gammaproteobacteria bacterium]
MQSHAVLTFFTAASLAIAAHAETSATCRIEPFSGATLPQGAVAQMTMANTGASCAITNYGVPAERQNAAYSGSITSAATHGTASFTPPRATYTPQPGFVGDDEFAYAAMAKGHNGQQITLRVRVKVKVVAP